MATNVTRIKTIAHKATTAAITTSVGAVSTLSCIAEKRLCCWGCELITEGGIVLGEFDDGVVVAIRTTSVGEVVGMIGSIVGIGTGTDGTLDGESDGVIIGAATAMLG
jgi:hypothetical protein